MNPLINRQVSRRTIVGAGALGAAFLTFGATAGATPAIAVDNQQGDLPALGADLSEAFVVWGPATAVTGDFHQGPTGLPTHSVISKLSKLLATDKGENYGVVPEYGFNNGSATETSGQTLALRSAAHPYKPNFYYNGQNGMMPRTGQLIVSTTDGRLPAENSTLYTHIGGVYCSLETVPNRPNKMLIKVVGDGVDRGTTPVKVGSGAASWARSGFEAYHRGHKHLLWMGRDNIEQTGQVFDDIRTAYDIEPETSVVLGHYATAGEAPGRRAAVETLNTKLAAAYGEKFFDVAAALRDSTLWEIAELAVYGIGTSSTDRDDLNQGLPPRSLLATDGTRLNNLGNHVLAHGLARFLTGAAGIYPADRYKPS